MKFTIFTADQLESHLTHSIESEIVQHRNEFKLIKAIFEYQDHTYQVHFWTGPGGIDTDALPWIAYEVEPHEVTMTVYRRVS